MNGLLWFWRKYAVMLRLEWSVMLAYRSETVVWMLGAFIQPLVSLAVWLSISGNGSVAGYDAHDYIVYFLGVLLVERLTRTWDVWELDSSISDGSMSAKLLRPFHPIHWSMAQNLVYKLFFALTLIPIWLVLAWMFPLLRLGIGPGAYAAAALAIALSSIMRFLLGFEFGMLAFWTNRATAIYALFEGVHLFLAGRLAPLSMFPGWVDELGKWLPFYGTVGFPVELMTGKLAAGSPEALLGFVVQAFWCVVLYVLFRWQWRQGVRRYGAVGG